MNSTFRLILQILIPALIVYAAIEVVKRGIAAKPPLKSKPVKVVIPSLSVASYSAGEHQPPVKTFGVVKSQFETQLKPLVTGQITEVSAQFNIGERVNKGTLLVTIDSTDYKSAKAQAEYNLNQTTFLLKEELVLAEQAREDWIESGRKLEEASDYLLRKPQIKAAKANVLAKEEALKKAIADIERTMIKAPFNAIVTSRTTSLGNLASQQETLGTLVSTDIAEVRLPLTKEQLLRMPKFKDGESLEVTLTSPLRPGAEWMAKLVRIDPTINASNQTVYAIAEVTNPYTTDKPPLAIGTFVDAKLPTLPIQRCFAVPNSAIVNDDFIWSVSKHEKDDIVKKMTITRVFSNETTSFIKIEKHPAEQPITIITRPLSNLTEDSKIIPVNQ